MEQQQTRDSRFVVTYTNNDVIGRIVYWTLQGGSTPVQELDDALLASGVEQEHLPKQPSVVQAFHRAVRTLNKEMSYLGGYIRKSTSNPRRYNLVIDQDREGGIDIMQSATISLEGDQIVFSGDETIRSHVAATADLMFEFYKSNYDTQDISTWLVQTVARLQSVSLRPTGGFYFVPPTTLDQLDTIFEVLKNHTPYQVFNIPAMDSESSSAAVLAAVIADAQRSLNEIDTALDNDKLKSKALYTLAGRAFQATQKLETYESVLSTSLEELRGQLDELRVKATEAALESAPLPE